ncbi:hypothetical protein PPSIR1_22856 [Plesiocystis pacifica SIR-1]|uniref:Uncharacterized protein n=1 Tax=Plesiocystis pacifica SIR-1 TaxID=391625 RepID=A6G2J4_9BACT|nr:hypothetical protein PPSIR1_22856 [Plesiocystis pacifica SIR-1]
MPTAATLPTQARSRRPERKRMSLASPMLGFAARMCATASSSLWKAELYT